MKVLRNLRNVVKIRVACLAVIVMSTSAFAQTFSGGSGTSSDPYQISKSEDLVELSNYVNSDMSTNSVSALDKNTNNKYFVMTQSIDMQDINFIPIGQGSANVGGSLRYRWFCGTFDGNGYSIKNLFIDTSIVSMPYVGLFGCVGNANIYNVTLDRAFYAIGRGGGSGIGGMVGGGMGALWNMNNCTVLNSTFKWGYGMVGDMNGGVINNCHVIDVTIEGVTVYGFSGPLLNSQISNSSVSYSTLTSSEGGNLAGFANLLPTNVNSSIRSSCVINCNLSGAGYAAGFARSAANGTISDCYTQSKLSRTANDNNRYEFAGFVYSIGAYLTGTDLARILRCYTTNDFASPYPNKEIAWGYGVYNGFEMITNCHYNADRFTAGGTVTAGTGVTGKTTAYMTSQSMVDELNGSFTIWKADFSVNPINKGYPILLWQQNLLLLSAYVVDIGHTTATFEGYAFTDADPFMEYGFEWREKGAMNWTPIQVTLGGKNFSAPAVTGLQSNTEYECRVYAKTAATTLYGDIMPFKTLLRQATVTTLPSVNMTDSTAILKGQTAQNDETIFEEGFEWRIKGTTNWDTVAVVLSLGNISLPLTKLTKHEAYEFRAYIVTENARRYGKILAFTAADPYDTTITIAKIAEVTTLPATNITDKSATIHGIVVANDETVLSQGFEWRILYSGNNWTVSPVSSGTSIIALPLSGLTNHTPYEFRAYVQTPDATRYGVILTFTTTEEDVTNIKEIQKQNGISIFPNPTSKQLQIAGYELSDVNYSIFSVVGQLLLQGTLQNETTNINVESLANGMYFLQIGNKTVRFVKQ